MEKFHKFTDVSRCRTVDLQVLFHRKVTPDVRIGGFFVY